MHVPLQVTKRHIFAQPCYTSILRLLETSGWCGEGRASDAVCLSHVLRSLGRLGGDFDCVLIPCLNAMILIEALANKTKLLMHGGLSHSWLSVSDERHCRRCHRYNTRAIGEFNNCWQYADRLWRAQVWVTTKVRGSRAMDKTDWQAHLHGLLLSLCVLFPFVMLAVIFESISTWNNDCFS